MMNAVPKADLYRWCSIPARELPNHPELRVPFRIVGDSAEMGTLMARELVDEIEANIKQQRATRAIIPCGPTCWYAPFAELVNKRNVSLQNLFVFHMDECLDWQGRPLPPRHPYNFRSFMERHFYGGIRSELAVPEKQDGHIAYNQARRHPYSTVSLEEVANSTIRIQENNLDTILALAQRTFGSAYQFVPPMSITLGVKECLSAKKVRVYSDTGAWKQTALRVALFSEPTPEYPMTLLQRHPDAIITATEETARHPISENPDWELF
jgi:glucosamine-6-phosphate deaminase